MNPLRKLPSLFVVMLCSAAGLLRAEEQTSIYRVLGLCSPDRQEELRQLMSAAPEVQLISLDYDKAEAVLRYDLAKLLPAAKKPKDLTPEKILKALNDQIRVRRNNTLTFADRSTLSADQLTRLEIPVGILDCKGCRYTAYAAVAKIDGVERATVSAETRMLTAWIDAAKTSRAALEGALKKAGALTDTKP